jgi:hypothetical protein
MQTVLAGRSGLHVNTIKRLERFPRIPCSTWFSLKRVAEQLPELLPRVTVPRSIHPAPEAGRQNYCRSSPSLPGEIELSRLF